MGTTLKAELSKSNPYWLEKHRYYELKHFCLQYQSWKTAYSSLDGLSGRNASYIFKSKSNMPSDSTAEIAMVKSYYSDRMRMIERTARQTDRILSDYIFRGVVNGWSYDILNARFGVPCCKDIYYELYRRFFWLLDKERA